MRWAIAGDSIVVQLVAKLGKRLSVKKKASVRNEEMFEECMELNRNLMKAFCIIMKLY